MTIGEQYRRIVAQLENRPDLPGLKPEHVWHPGLDAEIADLPLAELAGDRQDGAASAQALVAALHLWNDSLDAAHELVQDLNGATGSALHGIMHRLEGDYSNAKYWFRRAGDHPAWHGLQSRASAWLREAEAAGKLSNGQVDQALRSIPAQGMWNPYLFTDLVAMTADRSGDDASIGILEQLQHQELTAFLRFLESRLTIE